MPALIQDDRIIKNCRLQNNKNMRSNQELTEAFNCKLTEVTDKHRFLK